MKIASPTDRPRVCRIIFIIFSVACSAYCGAFDLDSQVDPSYDPSYLKKFLDPDSELFRNITVCPKAWHVKEMPAILKLWGLAGEEHKVTTEDGYIISFFRLTPHRANATPVLMLYGLLASPELFLMRGKEDLAVLLGDAGFDVWLANYRGTHYSRQHVNLTTEDKQFWDFSFHEHGMYDVPAMIDHILLQTGRPTLVAMGHSMSNAVVFAMLSLRPEYNEKIHLYVGLAPFAVVKMARTNQFRRTLLRETVKLLLRGNKNWESRDVLRRRKINPLVGQCWSLPRLCYTITQYGCGRSAVNFDWKLIPALMAYFPSGSSNKNLKHLYRLRHGEFVQYDYGREGNMERYGTRTPPTYDLSKIRIPVSLYYGETDVIVSLEGKDAQTRALPNVFKSVVVPGYNHIDFLFARNTRDVLYNPVIEDIKRYDPYKGGIGNSTQVNYNPNVTKNNDPKLYDTHNKVANSQNHNSNDPKIDNFKQYLYQTKFNPYSGLKRYDPYYPTEASSPYVLDTTNSITSVEETT